MIAMTIFSTVIIAVYSSWSAIVRGAKAGTDAAAEAQRSRIAMRTIEDALLTTQLYTENIRYYNFVADTSDPKFAWLSLTARLPETFPGSGLFGDQVVRRVTFAVEPGPDGTNRLVMTQIPLLLVTNSDVSAYPITLARDVTLFVLEFWDPKLSDWASELETTNVIPLMVRVSLGIGHVAKSSSQPSEITSRIIAMPSIAVGADVQRPARQPGPGGGGPGGGGKGNNPPGSQNPGSGQPNPNNPNFNPNNPNGFPRGGPGRDGNPRFTPGGPSGPRPGSPGSGINPGGGVPRRSRP